MSANQGIGPPPLGPRHWPAWLGVGAMALLARLPWSWQRALGTPLGALLRALLGERRRIALRNLELCFPGLDVTAREALLREHFRDRQTVVEGKSVSGRLDLCGRLSMKKNK